MAQSVNSSRYFQQAALKLLGAAALLLIGVPLVPMVVPGYTQPLWIKNGALAVGLIFLVVGLGTAWISQS